MITSIDIGTSYSSVSILGPTGKTVPVDISTGMGFSGKYSMPTAVYLQEDGKFLVGQAAMNSRMKKPQNFRMEFKRIWGDSSPILIGGQEYHVEELYTELFRHMKTCVQKLSKEEIEQVYLTCPASYGEHMKNQLLSAAAAAGLFGVELVEEPVAAAMSYYAEGYIKDGETLLIYDFGGGTFDVALVKCENGSFRLLGDPQGLPRCGGSDMDRMIYENMLQAIGNETISEIRNNEVNFHRFSSKLLELAVKVKHQLSSAEIAVEDIPVGGWDSVEYRLNRQSFEKMIAPMVGKTIQLCREELENTGMTIADISAIVMVGGTSRVPLVQKMLEQFAKKTPVLQVPDLDLAVVNGALNYQKRDLGTAEQWYEKGCKLAEAENYEEAVKWYRKAAEAGSANGQGALANCYEDGKGVAKDLIEAAKWYRKAAAQGDSDSQFKLGYFYDEGKGVTKNPAIAVAWYRQAAEQGHSGAQNNLGLCYEYGIGVSKNLGEAVKWYHKSAEQGRASAQRLLGDCYKNGKGIQQSYRNAVTWYRKAAEQGYADAQHNLAVCYVYGEGVPQSYREAVRWYRKAAEQGHVDSKKNLELCRISIVEEVLAEQKCRNSAFTSPVIKMISRVINADVYAVFCGTNPASAFFGHVISSTVMSTVPIHPAAVNEYFAFTAKGIAWGNGIGEPNIMAYEMLADAEILTDSMSIRLSYHGETSVVRKFVSTVPGYSWNKLITCLLEIKGRLQ